MKRTDLFVVVILLVFGRTVHAKDFSYASPDKSKKASYTCNYSYAKTMTEYGAGYKTHCVLKIIPKKGSTCLVVEGDFSHPGYLKGDENNYSVSGGIPAWSADSRFFVAIISDRFGGSKKLYLVDTASSNPQDAKSCKSTLLFTLNNKGEENFCTPDKKGDITNKEPKVVMGSQSFSVCTYGGTPLTSIIKNEKEIYTYNAFMYKYAFSGSLISKTKMTVSQWNELSTD